MVDGGVDVVKMEQSGRKQSIYLAVGSPFTPSSPVQGNCDVLALSVPRFAVHWKFDI